MDKKWLAVFGLALLTACGVSPLFNHLSAEEAKGGEGLQAAPTAEAGRPAADCPIRFSKVKLCARYAWSKESQVKSKVGEAVLLFFQEGKPELLVSPAESVEADLFMPSHGHDDGDDEIPVVAKVTTGVYLVQQVKPTMIGPWRFDIRLVDKSGAVIDESSFSFSK